MVFTPVKPIMSRHVTSGHVLFTLHDIHKPLKSLKKHTNRSRCHVKHPIPLQYISWPQWWYLPLLFSLHQTKLFLVSSWPI